METQNDLNKVNCHVTENPYLFEEIESIANFLATKYENAPEIGIVCGSGLATLADDVEEQIVIPYSEIPNFPQSSVKGHKSRLVFGKLGGKNIVCMQGRFHFYEGYSIFTVIIGIRVMKALGCKSVIITNAAGGLNPDFNIGDIMVIDDHINLPGMTGNNPLFGPNDERFGTRFPSTSDLYDIKLQDMVKEVAAKNEITGIREGVYVFVTGPSFETPAEARFLRMIGGDTVGMSTVAEAIAAHHMGMKVIGLSLVTNNVVQDKRKGIPANHKEVLETAAARTVDMKKLVKGIITEL